MTAARPQESKPESKPQSNSLLTRLQEVVETRNRVLSDVNDRAKYPSEKAMEQAIADAKSIALDDYPEQKDEVEQHFKALEDELQSVIREKKPEEDLGKALTKCKAGLKTLGANETSVTKIMGDALSSSKKWIKTVESTIEKSEKEMETIVIDAAHDALMLTVGIKPPKPAKRDAANDHKRSPFEPATDQEPQNDSEKKKSNVSAMVQIGDDGKGADYEDNALKVAFRTARRYILLEQKAGHSATLKNKDFPNLTFSRDNNGAYSFYHDVGWLESNPLYPHIFRWKDRKDYPATFGPFIECIAETQRVLGEPLSPTNALIVNITRDKGRNKDISKNDLKQLRAFITAAQMKSAEMGPNGFPIKLDRDLIEQLKKAQKNEQGRNKILRFVESTASHYWSWGERSWFDKDIEKLLNEFGPKLNPAPAPTPDPTPTPDPKPDPMFKFGGPSNGGDIGNLNNKGGGSEEKKVQELNSAPVAPYAAPIIDCATSAESACATIADFLVEQMRNAEDGEYFDNKNSLTKSFNTHYDANLDPKEFKKLFTEGEFSDPEARQLILGPVVENILGVRDNSQLSEDLIFKSGGGAFRFDLPRDLERAPSSNDFVMNDEDSNPILHVQSQMVNGNTHYVRYTNDHADKEAYKKMRDVSDVSKEERLANLEERGVLKKGLDGRFEVNKVAVKKVAVDSAAASRKSSSAPT